jgi:hypothetical protein
LGGLGSRQLPPDDKKPRTTRAAEPWFPPLPEQVAHFHKVEPWLHKFINDGSLLNY